MTVIVRRNQSITLPKITNLRLHLQPPGGYKETFHNFNYIQTRIPVRFSRCLRGRYIYHQMPYRHVRVDIFDLPIDVSSSSFPIQQFLSHRKICITAKVIASRNFTIKYYKTDAIKTTFGVALWQTSRMQKCTCNLARRHSDVQLLSTHTILLFCAFYCFPTSDVN